MRSLEIEGFSPLVIDDLLLMMIAGD